MKKFASISIDLRQSSLVRVSDESSMKPKSQIKPNNKTEPEEDYLKRNFVDCQIPEKNKTPLEHNDGEVAFEDENKPEDGPTTVIHLKMVSPNKEEDVTESKDTFHENSLRENKISDVKKLMDEMRKEKMNECKKNENEKIREFEINRQLERLKSETKRNVRKHEKSCLNSQTSISKKECLTNRDEIVPSQNKNLFSINNSQDNNNLLNDNFDSSICNINQIENDLKSDINSLIKDESSCTKIGNNRNKKLLRNANEKEISKSQLKIDQIDKIISHLTASDILEAVKKNLKNGDKIKKTKNIPLNSLKNNLKNNDTSDNDNIIDSDDNKTDTENNLQDTNTLPSITTVRQQTWLKGPASYKRRCLSSKRPLSKRRKLWSDHGMEVDESCMLSAEGFKWLVVQTPAQQQYLQGHYIFKDLPIDGGSLMETVRVCVCNGSGDDSDGGEDEDEKYNQIGKEVLKLGNLSNEDISELKKQVKEEQHHKDSENIMPILLNMSWEQIESSYNRNNNDTDEDYNTLPDITSKEYSGGRDMGEDGKKDIVDNDLKSDEDDEEEIEEEVEKEEEEEDVEFKSLDTLYQEEFSKSGYKKLLEQLENDPYQLDEKNNFWQDNNYDYKRLKDGVYYDNEPVTDYSRSRPKRASVDYTPSAFTVIRYMEGGRPSRKPMSRRKSRGDVGGAVSSNESMLSEEGGRRRGKERVIEEDAEKVEESGSGDDDYVVQNGGNGHEDPSITPHDVVSDKYGTSHKTDPHCNDLNNNDLKSERIKEKLLTVSKSNNDSGGNNDDDGDDEDDNNDDVSVQDDKSVDDGNCNAIDETQNTSNDTQKSNITSFKYDDDEEEVDDNDDDEEDDNDDDDDDDDDGEET